MLTDERMAIACETDIPGAITSVMLHGGNLPIALRQRILQIEWLSRWFQLQWRGHNVSPPGILS